MKQLSAMYCEHANEMPASCPCPEDCYCKSHSCRRREASVKDTVYEIRCFKDGRRMGTHELSKTDAKWFRKTARHLGSYLSKSYGLTKKPKA